MIEFGKEYKYRELCKALEIEPLRRGYQKNQMSQLAEKYDIEKLPNKKYVVHKEYTDEEIESNQPKRFIDKYNAFDVLYEDRHKSGVYIIQNDYCTYIGQTKDFQNRYKRHCHDNGYTCRILENGGKFTILKIMSNSTRDERLKEEKVFIDEYLKRKDKKCINKHIRLNKFEPNTKNTRYIRIEIDDYECAVQILKDNGVKFYERRRINK